MSISSAPRHPLDDELRRVADHFNGLVRSAITSPATDSHEDDDASHSQHGTVSGDLSTWPTNANESLDKYLLTDMDLDTTIGAPLDLDPEEPSKHSDVPGNITPHMHNPLSNSSFNSDHHYLQSLYVAPDEQSSYASHDNARQSSKQDARLQLHTVEFTEVFKIPVSPLLARELALPSSYSYNETSFVRRLMRSSLEAAFMVVLNPTPQDTERLFTYAFCFIGKPQLLTYFKAVLDRTTKENLELWSVPLFHVGNAGLHYPRDGIDASSPAPAWWAQPGPIGPLPPRQGPTKVPNSATPSDLVNFTGVSGEWFDSNDVEQYLRTRGLELDARSSRVEIKDPNEEYKMTNDERLWASQSHSFPLNNDPFPQNALGTFTDDALAIPSGYSDDSTVTGPTDFTNLDLDLDNYLPAEYPMHGTGGMANPAVPSYTGYKPRRVFDVDVFVKGKNVAPRYLANGLTRCKQSSRKVSASGEHCVTAGQPLMKPSI